LRSSWPALHAQLLRSTTTLAFQRQFQAMCGDERTLAAFADPAALFDSLHGADGDPAARNVMLAALVRQAQAGAAAAVTVLLLALWPGLDAVHRRLARHFRADPDVFVSDIPARVVVGIHALDLTRVNRIAATLIRNCERDIVRSLQRRSAEASRHRPIDEELVFKSPDTSVLGLPEDLDADAVAACLIELLDPIVGADARLVVAIAVEGERQATATQVRGLKADAGRKRYQRALRRLRVRFEEIL
jgi:RNA polymerase sigma-70 factor (ECF subfamily)